MRFSLSKHHKFIIIRRNEWDKIGSSKTYLKKEKKQIDLYYIMTKLNLILVKVIYALFYNKCRYDLMSSIPTDKKLYRFYRAWSQNKTQLVKLQQIPVEKINFNFLHLGGHVLEILCCHRTSIG